MESQGRVNVYALGRIVGDLVSTKTGRNRGTDQIHEVGLSHGALAPGVGVIMQGFDHAV